MRSGLSLGPGAHFGLSKRVLYKALLNHTYENCEGQIKETIGRTSLREKRMTHEEYEAYLNKDRYRSWPIWWNSDRKIFEIFDEKEPVTPVGTIEIIEDNEKRVAVCYKVNGKNVTNIYEVSSLNKFIGVPPHFIGYKVNIGDDISYVQYKPSYQTTHITNQPVKHYITLNINGMSIRLEMDDRKHREPSQRNDKLLQESSLNCLRSINQDDGIGDIYLKLMPLFCHRNEADEIVYDYPKISLNVLDGKSKKQIEIENGQMQLLYDRGVKAQPLTINHLNEVSFHVLKSSIDIANKKVNGLIENHNGYKVEFGSVNLDCVDAYTDDQQQKLSLLPETAMRYEVTVPEIKDIIMQKAKIYKKTRK